MFIAAVVHGAGLVAGQVASDSAGGEILGARRLIRELDVADRVLTLDALHSCPKTASLIVEKGADYVMPVKGNHQDLLDDLQAFDWDAAPAFSTADKGHGRLEVRTCALVPLDGVDEGVAALPGRHQAFRIVRERTVISTGKCSVEATHGLTSLGPERAGPAEVLALNRGHWEIENRLHYVRDFSYDEDRSRVRNGKLPRNLACLSNAAISIVRLRGRFRHQPQAHRHLSPPGRTRPCAKCSAPPDPKTPTQSPHNVVGDMRARLRPRYPTPALESGYRPVPKRLAKPLKNTKNTTEKSRAPIWQHPNATDFRATQL